MEQNGWGPPAVDLNFLKSGLGVLKLVQMVLSLAGFIIAEVTASPYNWEQMKAFEWISLTIFILTLAVFTTFLASWHKSEAVVRVNWPLVDFCHSALCTVLWSINLILGLVSISWYYYPTREGGAIAGTDFCHSALCTVLWSINLILALVVTSDYGPGDLVGTNLCLESRKHPQSNDCWYSPQQDNTEMSGKNLERSIPCQWTRGHMLDKILPSPRPVCLFAPIQNQRSRPVLTVMLVPLFQWIVSQGYIHNLQTSCYDIHSSGILFFKLEAFDSRFVIGSLMIRSQRTFQYLKKKL